MPKSAHYTVSWLPERAEYVIMGPEMAEPGCFSPVWLEGHRAFAFHGRNGQVNLLKEKRRRGGEGYWYAYRRHRGKMLKRYVGRDAQLSLERLEEIAAALADEIEAAPPVALEQSVEDKLHLDNDAFRAALGSQDEDELHPDKRASLAASSDGDGSHALPFATDAGQSKALFFEPLLMSRLQLPRPQKALLAREHLLALLDQGLEHKATFVCGPAGYGKTTLIAQWIAARGARGDFPRVASVTLDNGDNDPVRFWRYVIAACQRFAPELGEEALKLLLAHRLPPFQFKPLEMVLVALLNDLSQLDSPGVLILDDLHIVGSPQVAESLGFFLEHLPCTLHLILLMRGDPPFSLTRLHARNEVLDFPPLYLGFSLEETRDFLAQELPFALSPRVVRELHQRLEGWPAGLRLFSRGIAHLVNEQEVERMLATFAGNHWSLREYFLGEVLHRLPEEQQAFLLQTSVLPRVTPALCDALMGREDSARLIEALRSGDFFLIPLDWAGEWSRYQSLFAEAMQQEARMRLGDERLNQLAVQASVWYEEHGLLAEAIETALNAAAFTRASSLIERFIESKRQSNTFIFLELYSLRRWLEALPEEELERTPDFCLHYAMIILFTLLEGPRAQSGRERIYHLLQVAEQQWRDANETMKLAEVFAFRALLARQEGRVLQALTWARQALAWLPAEDLIWRTIALTVVGIGAVLSGTLAQAREALQEASVFNERLGNVTYQRATRGMLSWVHFEQGELHYAAEQFRQMQIEARAQEDTDDIARTQLALAQLFYEWNKLEESEQAALEALALGEQMAEEEFLCMAALRLAQIEQARGQTVQAQQRLTAWLARGPLPISPQSYQYQRQVQAALARIQLTNGDLAAVKRWSAGLEQRAEILPLYQRQREQVLIARLLLAQGEQPEALELLIGLMAAAQQTGHLSFALHIQIVLALAYARQGAHTKAREQLYNALATAQSEGHLRLFLDEGEEMADLLRRLLPHLREHALLSYTRGILDAFSSTTGSLIIEKPAISSSLLEPLSSQEQKVLRLLVAGNSNAEIARELIVSVNTVRTQVQSIYRKLDVNNRVQASTLARQLNLL